VDSATLDGEDRAGDSSLVRVLVAAGMTPSSSEARRMIRQGAVDVDGERVADVNARITHGDHLVRVGKRVFKRVVLR
jgi:tyrosyl-tRNA synthetase